MKTYTSSDLEQYMKNDWIMDLVDHNIDERETEIRTNQWLISMDNKRMIYADVYGDILHDKSARKVLDVGGGYNSLTKVLASHSQYTLVDFMAHGGEDYLRQVSEKYHIHWMEQDWYDMKEIDDYDVVIANDLFPDVDQRLEQFIDKMLPHCHELRLVVTYYNTPCFYTTKRLDDSEIMTFLSWDGEITGLKLRKYVSRSNASERELETMKDNYDSIYRNGRQVSYIVIKGDL